MIILNRIFWLLNILAGVMLLLSYAAPLVNPSFWWVLAFFGLAFPVLFFVNVLFCVYWIILGKLKLIFPLLCLTLGYGHFEKIFKFDGRHAEREENDVMMVSMNVSDFGQRKSNNFIDTFALYLKHIEADIVCVQEFSAQSAVSKENNIKRINRVSKRSFYLIQGKQPGAQRGPAIFSRFKPLNSGYLSFGLGATNGAVWADIILPGKDTVRVYSCHLQSNRLGSKERLTPGDVQNQELAKRKTKNLIRRLKYGFERREQQVHMIEEHANASPYKIIIAGDMNDTQLSYAYRVIRADRKDAFVESGQGQGNTYVGPFPSYRIDYLFHDANFQSFNYRSGPHFKSDHKLIQALIKH